MESRQRSGLSPKKAFMIPLATVVITSIILTVAMVTRSGLGANDAEPQVEVPSVSASQDGARPSGVHGSGDSDAGSETDVSISNLPEEGKPSGSERKDIVNSESVPAPSNFPAVDSAQQAQEAVASYINNTYSDPIDEIVIIGSDFSEPQQRGDGVVMWATYLVRFANGKRVGLVCSMQDGVETTVAESNLLTVSNRETYDVETETYQQLWPYPNYDPNDYEEWMSTIDPNTPPAID